MSIIFRAKKFFFILILIKSVSSFAQKIETSFSADIITGIEATNIRESIWNPENHALRLFDKNAHLDLRPVLEIEKAEWFKFVLRPRFEANYGTIPQNDEYSTKSKRDIWMNEGFLSLYPLDNIHLHIGRQTFLWGPSEVVSPSNPLYSDVLNRVNPLFQLRGLYMARANVSIGDNFNLVSMAETKPIKDADFQNRSPEEENEKHRFLIKPEFSSTDGAFIAGVTLGENKVQPSFRQSHRNGQFYGGYIMWSANSAIQLYTDVRVDMNSRASHTFYVTGIRYTFEDGTEWRNEYIYKELGLTQKKLKEMNTLIFHPFYSQAIINFQEENQDNLNSEEYYYSSLRKTLTSTKLIDRPIIGLRSLYSLTNQSGILSTFFEMGIGESTTVTIFLAQTYGSKFGEFNQTINSSGGIMARFSF